MKTKRPRTERRAPRRAFTLIELMLVIMLMAFLGSFAMSGYRALQRGMSERGVRESVNMFMRVAYQRCKMDRMPVMVCVWNETVAEETEDEPVKARGRAVAVRRLGRLTRVSDIDGTKVLCDEFGDLESMRYVNEEGEKDDETAEEHVLADIDGGNATYLYRVNGNETTAERSIVSHVSLRLKNTDLLLSDGTSRDFRTYGYGVISAESCGNWKVGDAYGVTVADLTLPNEFIFGSSFSRSVTSPVSGEKVFFFTPDGSAVVNLEVWELRLQDSGSFDASKVFIVDSPGNKGGS